MSLNFSAKTECPLFELKKGAKVDMVFMKWTLGWTKEWTLLSRII
jgi:Cu/Ag efflux protein CusF